MHLDMVAKILGRTPAAINWIFNQDVAQKVIGSNNPSNRLQEQIEEAKTALGIPFKKYVRKDK